MNAKDKFQITNDGVRVTPLKEYCHILMHDEFFRGLRKQLRGLEEHLAMRAWGMGEVVPPDHDFQNGVYVYAVTTVENSSIVIRFDGEWCIFGSSATI